ncbi:MAG: BatD family protein, partial [Granulosicoccaceae bacterium]
MRRLIVIFALYLPLLAVAAELQVQLDRLQLYEDESLVMSVQLRDGSADNFDPVLDDFEILQRSQGSQTQIVNGHRSDSYTWEFVLAPRRTGELRVPAFEFSGTQSQEIKVQVKSLAEREQGPEDRPFFLKVSVSESQPFVQQQVVYTMKLYQQQPIADGNVTEPDHPDVLIERLGLDRSYHEQVDGREYSVLERRYALFPQRSGEIVLPSINLNARVQVGQRSNRFFAPNTRNIRVRAPSLTLEVRPAIAEYKAAWWLASTNVLGEAKWQPESANVGEPLTLELQLSAEGVMPAQLPELSDPLVSGARLYSNGSRAAKKASSTGVVAQRVMSWTIVPTRPGALEIAAFEVPWWDLSTGEQKLLEIEVPSLQIEGDLIQEPAPTRESDADARESTDSGTEEAAPTEQPKEVPFRLKAWFSDWRTLLVMASIVALAALVVRRRRRRPLPLQTDEQLCSPDAALVRLVEAVTRADIKAG